MKAVRILIVLWSALAALSCQRRPLTVADNNVMVRIEIDRDIVNYELEKDPAMMRVMFFECGTGRFAAQAFLSPEGGYVNVVPGRRYDLLVYNFDTRSTVVQDEYVFGQIAATTNEVPESVKSALRSRGSKYEDERIVFEPDHLFAGRLTDVYIPARGVDSDPVVLQVTATTVVQTWKLYVETIQGVEWIAGVSGVISGLAGGNRLSTGERTSDLVSVFFETLHLQEDGKLVASFNTFGYNPDSRQVLSLVIIDVSGRGHEFNIDISGQFVDNEAQAIHIVTDEIVIEEPEDPGTGGGGLQPDVDEWENIENDIII